jgi:CMP-N-acetylneuraminic acid synthetase
MKTFAFIFARGGSKGVPGKNIRDLGGKPLLAHSIKIAQEINEISRIFVSTDDQEIANVGIEYGAEIIKRPAKLAQDDSPEWHAWRHAIKWAEDKGINFDIFLSLPTTAPLRNEKDIIKCLKNLDEDTDIVVTMTETTRSPWFNMVREEDGYLKFVVEDEMHYNRRQDTPRIYDMTTVAYVTRTPFIRKASRVFDGRVKGVLIPPERALDIDTELDFSFAEFLMAQKKNSVRKIIHAE